MTPSPVGVPAVVVARAVVAVAVGAVVAVEAAVPEVEGGCARASAVAAARLPTEPLSGRGQP